MDSSIVAFCEKAIKEIKNKKVIMTDFKFKKSLFSEFTKIG